MCALDQRSEQQGSHVGLGGEREVEDPGGPVGEYQGHRHYCVGAAVGDAWNGKT